MLVGGFDTSHVARDDSQEGADDLGGVPKLFWIDYLGTMVEVPFAAHGYGSYFALSLLDRCVALQDLLGRSVLTPSPFGLLAFLQIS